MYKLIFSVQLELLKHLFYFYFIKLKRYAPAKYGDEDHNCKFYFYSLPRYGKEEINVAIFLHFNKCL